MIKINGLSKGAEAVNNGGLDSPVEETVSPTNSRDSHLVTAPGSNNSGLLALSDEDSQPSYQMISPLGAHSHGMSFKTEPLLDTDPSYA